MAILVDTAPADEGDRVIGKHRIERSGNALPVVFVEKTRTRRIDQFIRLVAQYPLVGRRDIASLPVRPDADNQIAGIFGDDAKLLFAFAQGLFRHDAVVRVAQHAHHLERRIGRRVAHELDVDFYPAVVAVGTQAAHQNRFGFLASGGKFLECQRQPGRIVRMGKLDRARPQQFFGAPPVERKSRRRNVFAHPVQVDHDDQVAHVFREHAVAPLAVGQFFLGARVGARLIERDTRAAHQQHQGRRRKQGRQHHGLTLRDQAVGTLHQDEILLVCIHRFEHPAQFVRQMLESGIAAFHRTAAGLLAQVDHQLLGGHLKMKRTLSQRGLALDQIAHARQVT